MQGYQDVYMELSWMSVGLIVLPSCSARTGRAKAQAAAPQCTKQIR